MKRYKHPSIPHLPTSGRVGGDDSVLASTYALRRCNEVIASIKLDGENSTIYPDGYTHARSTNYSPHESRHALQVLANCLSGSMPPNMRICLENLYALHTIPYKNLHAYYQVHSIWQDEVSLPWDDVVDWCSKLRLAMVETFYRGPFDEAAIHQAYLNYVGDWVEEGYVIRSADAIALDEYRVLTAKWVSPNFVISDGQWSQRSMIANGVKYPDGCDLWEFLIWG